MLVMQVFFKANRKAGQRMLRVFLCFCTDTLAWDSGVSFAPDFSATLKKKRKMNIPAKNCCDIAAEAAADRPAGQLGSQQRKPCSSQNEKIEKR